MFGCWMGAGPGMPRAHWLTRRTDWEGGGGRPTKAKASNAKPEQGCGMVYLTARGRVMPGTSSVPPKTCSSPCSEY